MFRSARSSCSIYATWEICKSLPEETCLRRRSWPLCSGGRQPRGLPWKVRCNIFEIKLTWVITIEDGWPYDENQAQYGENNIQDIKNAKRFLKWFWTKHTNMLTRSLEDDTCHERGPYWGGCRDHVRVGWRRKMAYIYHEDIRTRDQADDSELDVIEKMLSPMGMCFIP